VASARAHDDPRASRPHSTRPSGLALDPSILAAGTAVAVAAALFALAYAEGGYAVGTRTGTGIVVWVAVGILLLLRRAEAVAVRSEAVVAGGLLLGFATLALASAAWGASTGTAFDELARTLVYLGVFSLAAVWVPRAAVARWLDGVALAVVAVAVVALASRFFPGVFPDRELPTFLPLTQARLSFPVDYWNGLAALVALALPLLLRAAVEHALPAARVAGAAAVPAVVAVLYLTSSRSGAAAAAVAAAGFVALTADRWRAVGALAVGGLTSVALVAFLSTRDALVNGPFDSAEAASQGRAGAVAFVVATAAAGAAWAFLPERVARAVTLPPYVGRAAAITLAVAFAAAVVAAAPVQRWDSFTAQPTAIEQQDFVRTHLLSSNGNWRWQYWTSAVDQFRESPLLGGGVGTYEAWWARHGSTVGFIENPHSLYFQVVGELGVVGLTVVVALLAFGIWTGARRALGRGPRGAGAAAAASLAGYAVTAGLDWMWQLTVVTVVAMLLLGLATGSATAPGGAARPTDGRARRAFVLVLAAVAVAAALIELDAWAADRRLAASRSASDRGDRAAALAAAHDARRLQPWAAAPYTQLALLEEDANHLHAARPWIAKALDRDRADWRLWVIAVRIDTRAGRLDQARRELHHAQRLNPRSPLFAKPSNP